jgi:hypothetical protein
MRYERLYYGPPGAETSMWWLVKVTKAKKPVVINGSVLHALKGYAGGTVGCAFSLMSTDTKNIGAFPHPSLLAAFNNSTAMIVTKLKADGSPAAVTKYEHNYGHITDANDNGTLKQMVMDDPSIMERSFTLHPPRNRAGEARYPRGGVDSKRATSRKFIPHGALARAVKAGRMGEAAAAQLTLMAQRQKEAA